MLGVRKRGDVGERAADAGPAVVAAPTCSLRTPATSAQEPARASPPRGEEQVAGNRTGEQKETPMKAEVLTLGQVVKAADYTWGKKQYPRSQWADAEDGPGSDDSTSAQVPARSPAAGP